jgi:hypothetical protein
MSKSSPADTWEMHRALLTLLTVAVACGGDSAPTIPAPPAQPNAPATPVVPQPTNPAPVAPKYDVEANGIPRFVSVSQIDLAPVSRVTKFRSSFGHDYADGFERCRCMKHYFQPKSGIDWSTIGIYSPVDGTVERVRVETTFGMQIAIRSSIQPAFTFIIFHVTPTIALDSGTRVTAGQRLGSHVGTQTLSDLAVGVDTPTGYKLVSWFDVITDELFAQYSARGMTSRASGVITRAERDADPLTCTGETFMGAGTLPTWVMLN